MTADKPTSVGVMHSYFTPLPDHVSPCWPFQHVAVLDALDRVEVVYVCSHAIAEMRSTVDGVEYVLRPPVFERRNECEHCGRFDAVEVPMRSLADLIEHGALGPCEHGHKPR